MRSLVALAVVVVAGCVGTVVPGEATSPGPEAPEGAAPAGRGRGATGVPAAPGVPGAPGATGAPAAGMPGGIQPGDSCQAPSFAPGAFRMLTPAEYGNTVRALVAGLGAAATTVEVPETPPMKIGFENRMDAWELSADYTDVVVKNAGRAAAAISRVRARLNPKCVEPPSEAECTRALIATVGRAAWRRPLLPAEQARFATRFGALRAKWSFEASVTALLEVLLTSPAAFHRPEIGEPVAGRAGVRRLATHELAQALAYAVTLGPPDEALARAADEGLLREAAHIEAHLARLVDEKKTAQGLARFFVDMLEVDRVSRAAKDAKTFPFYTDSVPGLLLESFVRSATALAASPDATLGDVLAGTHGFVRKELGPIFQITSTSTSFAAQDLGQTRAGIYTHPAFLAMEADELHAKPVHRARFVVQGALCVALADPPAEAVNAVAPDDPTLTARQKLTLATSGTVCLGCHRLLNPVSHAFEAYDAVGRHQARAGNQPIDTAGALPVGGREMRFRDLRDLLQQISGEDTARECFVSQWYTYVLGRDPESSDDCSRARSVRAFEQQGWKIRPLLRSVLTSDSFLFRKGA